MKLKSVILLTFFLTATLLLSCSKETNSNTDIATSVALDNKYIKPNSKDSADTSTSPIINTYRDDINAAIETTEKIEYSQEDYYKDWVNLDPEYIKLTGSSAIISGNGAKIKGNTITITKAGIYTISGQLDNGRIFVNLDKSGIVRLVLNDAKINNSDESPIFVKKAEKVIISLEKKTENIISGTSNNKKSALLEAQNAAIYSSAPLTINGTGSLTVNAYSCNGVTSLDTVKITDGNLTVNSSGDALTGYDRVAANGGIININTGKNGIISTNKTDSSKGLIELDGGKFTITAGIDGIQSENTLIITGGEFDITNSNTASKSHGLSAKSNLTINGGTFTIDTVDDALTCDDSITINSGNLTLSSKKSGIHANSSLNVTNGHINISQSNTGIDSGIITVLDGNIHLSARDYGIKLTTSKREHYLAVNGGWIKIDAENNAMDIDGTFFLTNGTVITDGQLINSKGTISKNENLDISGGLFVAAGSQISLTPSNKSTQYTIIYHYPEIIQSKKLCHLADNKNNSIMTFSPDKEYDTLVFSSPDLTQNKPYFLYLGGTATGNNTDGLFIDSIYRKGKLLLNFTLSNTFSILN
ncbi:carbohydrate-binding domain-containing protein [Anaerocolumna sp. MB42-C2]|uniref:carbohydrate-binding domain-containing protein n=1 Tax=Anaerocolumna sp. MB42-C2 TaxID=3070997 RepID=UPI0027E018B4|nr:carbohydrate-binding domain-containing protein [Anaerocolumna sp. MB42-C2]WMJ86541.1 carbohydrate-binding domain-containing protein [Anaerocolumna sp. MB42-C2]